MEQYNIYTIQLQQKTLWQYGRMKFQFDLIDLRLLPVDDLLSLQQCTTQTFIPQAREILQKVAYAQYRHNIKPKPYLKFHAESSLWTEEENWFVVVLAAIRALRMDNPIEPDENVKYCIKRFLQKEQLQRQKEERLKKKTTPFSPLKKQAKIKRLCQRKNFGGSSLQISYYGLLVYMATLFNSAKE